MKRLALLVSLVVHTLALYIPIKTGNQLVNPNLNRIITVSIIQQKAGVKKATPKGRKIKKTAPRKRVQRVKSKRKRRQPNRKSKTTHRPTAKVNKTNKEESHSTEAEEKKQTNTLKTKEEASRSTNSGSPPKPKNSGFGLLLPVVERKIIPEYPYIARLRRYEGKVLLKVLVSSSGRVSEVLIVKSSGHKILDKAAVEAVKRWLFKPAQVNGQKREAWVMVPITFRLTTP